jgi:hypothetical protein
VAFSIIFSPVCTQRRQFIIGPGADFAAENSFISARRMHIFGILLIRRATRALRAVSTQIGV